MVSHLRRDKFDPEREFYVNRPDGLKVSGEFLANGAPFDKGLVTLRRLRQLYDARQIAMVELEESAVSPKSFTVKVEDMTESQLEKFLTVNGITPRIGASRKWFVNRVKRFLEESGGQHGLA